MRAISVKLEDAKDVAVDANGNLYVAGCHGIWGNLGQIDKIDTLGLITVVARSDNGGFSGDGGPARAAALSCVASVAFDGAGNLFFADNTNNRVRRIDRSGIITTVAGSGPAAIDDHGKDISGAFGGDSAG